MVDWDKEMDAASQRDDQLIKDQEGRPVADLEPPVAQAVAATVDAPDVSFYERSIAAAAARRGVSQDAIMTEDYQQLSYSIYPTVKCLTPDELESIYVADPENLPAWMDDRLRHVETCKPCRRLFTSMHPDAESRKIFDRALRQVLAEKAVAATVGPISFLTRFRLAAREAVAKFRAG
jgi:hypothetical protein